MLEMNSEACESERNTLVTPRSNRVAPLAKSPTYALPAVIDPDATGRIPQNVARPLRAVVGGAHHVDVQRGVVGRVQHDDGRVVAGGFDLADPDPDRLQQVAAGRGGRGRRLGGGGVDRGGHVGLRLGEQTAAQLGFEQGPDVARRRRAPAG